MRFLREVCFCGLVVFLLSCQHYSATHKAATNKVDDEKLLSVLENKELSNEEKLVSLSELLHLDSPSDVLSTQSAPPVLAPKSATKQDWSETEVIKIEAIAKACKDRGGAAWCEKIPSGELQCTIECKEGN